MTGRGITTVSDIKARCKVDPATHCWLWHGGFSSTNGIKSPAIYAFDHAAGCKRVMTGTRGAWNVAHGAAPLPGFLVFRACCNPLCLNPAHLREARSKANICRHIARAGVLKGTHVEARRANGAKGLAAMGIVVTPPDVVLAVRRAPASETNRAIARRLGLSESVVSGIRLGKRHRHVTEASQ
jgi:hypothetical protein